MDMRSEDGRPYAAQPNLARLTDRWPAALGGSLTTLGRPGSWTLTPRLAFISPPFVPTTDGVRPW